MRRTIVEAVKQIIPPAILSLKRRVFRNGPPAETPRQRELRRAHEQLNQDVGEGEFRLRPGLTLKLHPESRHAFEAFCYTYPDMVVELDCFLKHAAGKQCLLDVGALHGIFSLVFATGDASRRAIAVDASPLAFSRLLYNIHTNKLNNIVPVECALSDGPGTVRMHYEWEHAVAAGTGAAGAGLTVEKRTADELCETLQFEPDIVKIDVEGHEVKVLNGMWATIARHRPLVFLEIHPRRIIEEGDQLGEIERRFANLGYRAESLSGEPIPMRAISEITVDQRIVLHPPQVRS